MSFNEPELRKIFELKPLTMSISILLMFVFIMALTNNSVFHNSNYLALAQCLTILVSVT